MPVGADADGHNAKHGYGRLNATLACATARDPIAATLIAMGEADMAKVWETSGPHPYTADFGRWASRVV